VTGFLMAFRFAIFMFVAIPFSICWGGRAFHEDRESAV